MRRSLLVAACLAGFAGALVSTGASAVALPKLEGLTTEKAVEPVQYRNYCRNWRHACANRWGWGTWRFRRCLSVRGCL